MRLGKKAKLNIAITILLCMVFVLNVGFTLAAVSYTFFGKSNATTDTVEAYTEFANVTNDGKREITYTEGSANATMDLNYGVSSAHDLMLEFTLSYNNTNHALNDVTINFVDRDMWCVDLPTFESMSTVEVSKQTQYDTTSTSNTLKGVMYYLGSINGSGTLPLISGVTFNKSSNLTANFSGDKLTITFTPYYEKSGTALYNTSTGSDLTNKIASYYLPTSGTPSHKFYTKNLTTSNYTAYNNWATYMKSYSDSVETNYVAENTFMVYNAHGTDASAIDFAYDFGIIDNLKDQVVKDQGATTTAYKYSITITESESGEIRYEKLIGCNRYEGGLGVHIFPSQAVYVKLTPTLLWEKEGTIQTGTVNPIHRAVNTNDVVELSTGIYANQLVTEPTYIDVLDYIMLTTQGEYQIMVDSGYKLVVCNLTIETTTTQPSGWQNSTPNYEVHNSTQTSPLLSRFPKAIGDTTTPVSISVSNNGATPIAITSFSVVGKLWYGDSTDPLEFKEVITYLTATDALVYDTTLWKTPRVDIDATTSVATYTFEANSTHYINPGSATTLITGVKIPAYGNLVYNEQNVAEAYDKWCTLDVKIVSTSVGTNSTLPTRLIIGNDGSANVINTTDTRYEFRIKSTTDLSEILVNPSDFIEQAVSGTYYYYYKGVVYENQLISIIASGATSNITLEIIEHSKNTDGDTQYVAGNYTTWAPPTEWLTAMKNIFGTTSEETIKNA